MSTVPDLSTRTDITDSNPEVVDDGYANSESQAKSLDDILRKSPMAEKLGLSEESLPEEDDSSDPTPDDSSEEEVPEENDEESDDVDEEGNEEDTDEESTDEDDTSTQDSEQIAEEDIDWEYKIPIKVDGKIEYVTLEEVRKGYSTDQHLSQKGRELGELKKQIEVERTEKLNELVQLGTSLHDTLTSEETKLASEYHRINSELQKARDDGDTYTARELRDQLEEAQGKYWEVRNQRESQVKAVAEKLRQEQAQVQQQLIEKFQEEIPSYVPNFSEKMAKDLRAFALNEGLPEELLNNIYDARVVKILNDYMQLKTAKDKGAEKRKAAPTKKSIPVKKGKSIDEVKAGKSKSMRAKVLTGEGSERDQIDFLKNLSSISKKL
jgi:hypothetical protein